ncbi:MAG: hypothetical protein HGA86_01455, partial [Anaerolineaceae bacterium]|nr:hypothetical protein [Anaerolineaceae bacterium]
IILFRSVRRSQTLLRNQAVFLLAGAVVPWVSNFIYLSGLNPFPGLDLTPFAFTITGILIASSIFRYQLFDIMPVAYDALFLHMGSGALVLDAQNRLVDINPVGQSLLEIESSAVGKPLESALSKHPEFYKTIVNNGSELNEILLNHRQSPLWIETRATPLNDKLDRTTGRLIVVQDITVRKQAEREIVIAREQAEEANLMKSQLLANVSHDLRTPLGAIIGYADMVRSDVYGTANAGQKQTMVEIIDSANQLLAFVNNLISQAQIETGKLTLNIRKFNPRIDLIDPLKSTFSLMAERKMLDVDFVISPSLPAEIYGDPYWIRQVMMNLVGNAVKFTEEGKVTVMLLQVDESRWAIQVSDTGIGIPSESRRMIFESFRQLDSSLTRKYGGSGLGLSIVKQLIDLMGGKVDLESEVGEGSTFTVVIPYQTVPETN